MILYDETAPPESVVDRAEEISMAPGHELEFRRISSKTVPLTIALAQEYHDMEASPTERDLSPVRVKHLAEKIKAGFAVSFIWASARLGDKTLRMNGNHSSNALVGLERFSEGLIAHIDEYEVDGADGLALLFRQFDDKKSARSTKDICGAYQGLYPNPKIVPKDTAKLSVEGVSYYRENINNPEGHRAPKGDDVGTLFGETPLHTFILFLGELFTIKTPELRKSAVVAAIYATFREDEKDAKDFWLETARGGQDYEDKAPSKVLDFGLKTFAESKDAREDMKPLNYYSGCVWAWNAHRKGKLIDKINWDVSKGVANPI